MRFIVTDKIHGEIVMKTVGYALHSGNKIIIPDEKQYEEDVQIAIQQGFIVAIEEPKPIVAPEPVEEELPIVDRETVATEKPPEKVKGKRGRKPKVAPVELVEKGEEFVTTEPKPNMQSWDPVQKKNISKEESMKKIFTASSSEVSFDEVQVGKPDFTEKKPSLRNPEGDKNTTRAVATNEKPGKTLRPVGTRREALTAADALIDPLMNNREVEFNIPKTQN